MSDSNERVLPVEISDNVEDVYSDFKIDDEKLKLFATNPEGALALDDEDLARAPLKFDAKRRNGVRGVTYDPAFPILGPIMNSRAGYDRDAIRVIVGVRDGKRARTPEEIERTLIHELRHVKQITHNERSLKAGKALMLSAYLGGLIGVPGIIEVFNPGKANPAVLALGGLYGALIGVTGGYTLAPHEREARKLVNETPYMGIVTGTPIAAANKGGIFQRFRQGYKT